MDIIFLWSSIGILTLFVLLGFLFGIWRGLKRSSLHIIVFIVCMAVALFITVPITNAILGITITIDGFTGTIRQQIIHFISQQVDLSNYGTMVSFIQGLPQAIVGPILFIVVSLVCYWLFSIIYHIIARVSFGKKKEDFKEHKPHRLFGGLVGAVEGFLFLFVLFAPLSALTKTYAQIIALPETTTQSTVAFAQNDKHLQSLSEIIEKKIPKKVNEAVSAYNKSVLGNVCGAGGLDNALFDHLSNFKVEEQKISLRKELISLGSTYNNFVVVYNNYIDKNFDKIDLAPLKKDIETFLNNGIFKKVITDTVVNIVKNYEEPKEPENPDEKPPKDFLEDMIDGLPDVAKDIILELKAKFSAEDFNGHEYLKHDILTVVDAADLLFKDDFIKQYTALVDPKSDEIITTVANNIDGLNGVLDKVLELNLINDAFPAVVSTIKDKVQESAGDFVDFSTMGNSLAEWQNELDYAFDALKALNKGEIGTSKQTYLQYILADKGEEKTDFEFLIKEISKQNGLKDVLNPILSSKLFEGLVNNLYSAVDDAIEGVTGVNPQSPKVEVAKLNKDNVIAVIEKIIPFALENENAEELNIAQIGDILSAVATESYNEGKENKGTFNNIFCNLIWYITGDDITADKVYNGKTTTFENADEVKAIINKTGDEYYTADYKTLLSNVEKVVKLADELSKKFPTTVEINTVEDAQKLVADVKEVIDTLTPEEKLEVLQTMETVVDALAEEYQIVPEDLDENLKNEIIANIEQTFGDDEDVAQTIKNILKLQPQTQA